MPLTATVVPGEQFPDNTTVTRARLRNAANPAVTLGGELSNGDVALDAGIALTQLAGISQNQVLVGGAAANGASGNNIVAVTLPTGGINSTTGITPSEGTVGYAELKAGTTNIIQGATDYGTGVVAKADKIIFSDGSDSGNIKKTSVENFLKSTFSTQVAYTDLTATGAGTCDLSSYTTKATCEAASPTAGVWTSYTSPGAGGALTVNTTVTVDLNGNPVQVIALNPPTGGDTSYTCTITYRNGPSEGYARNVMLVVSNNTPSTLVKLAFASPGTGKFWFLNTNPPESIAGNKLGVLAMTGWPGDKCIAGWAVEP